MKVNRSWMFFVVVVDLKILPPSARRETLKDQRRSICLGAISGKTGVDMSVKIGGRKSSKIGAAFAEVTAFHEALGNGVMIWKT